MNRQEYLHLDPENLSVQRILLETKRIRTISLLLPLCVFLSIIFPSICFLIDFLPLHNNWFQVISMKSTLSEKLPTQDALTAENNHLH